MDKTINEDINKSPTLNLSEKKVSSNSDALEDRESSESNISENQESSESNDTSENVNEPLKEDSSGIENSKSDEKVNVDESSLEKEIQESDKAEPENNDSTNQDSSSEVELTPGRKKLQSWLNKTLCVLMSDDRILVGIFLCTDRDCNIILGQCFEFLPPTENEEDDIEASKESRQIGLVMVPGKHIVKIFIDELGAAATPYSNIVEEDIM